jgi:hypothetical protein
MQLRRMRTHWIDEAFLTTSTHKLPTQGLQADYLVRRAQGVSKWLYVVSEVTRLSVKGYGPGTARHLGSLPRDVGCPGLREEIKLAKKQKEDSETYPRGRSRYYARR